MPVRRGPKDNQREWLDRTIIHRLRNGGRVEDIELSPRNIIGRGKPGGVLTLTGAEIVIRALKDQGALKDQRQAAACGRVACGLVT